MAKIYSKKTVTIPKMVPKKEIVSFLLNYSKAFSYIRLGKIRIENLAN